MEKRTSDSHPLSIDAVRCGLGEIGLTLCPGKKGASVYGAPWDRDLASDLAVIKKWGATTLVTFLEDHEFGILSVPDLGQKAEEFGLEWHHLPIPDVKVPTERFELLWTYSGHVLRKKLASGEKIVLHCRGGLGRTGVVGARLLIEFGLDPSDAIGRVRAARKGAIETKEQKKYVLSVAPPAIASDYADKVLGCLLGGAVGDAFGYIVEFDKLSAIQQKFGTSGLQQPVFQNGKFIVSDDTQMTLFTAEGLLNAASTDGSLIPERALKAINKATLDWLQTQTKSYPSTDSAGSLINHRSLWEKRAPGNTCLSACLKGASGTPESPVNNSKGCGGVMRVAPIGLCPSLDRETVFDLSARAAAQTHGHPSGYISAGFLATIIRDTLEDIDPGISSHQVFSIAHQWDGSEETVKAVDYARKLPTDHMNDRFGDIAEIGEGWVGDEALGIGLYSVFVSESFVDAIQIAANHDGDSDSTASIAGQVYGAWKGLAEIPHAWIRRLDVLEPVLQIARQMISVFGQQVAPPEEIKETPINVGVLSWPEDEAEIGELLEQEYLLPQSIHRMRLARAVRNQIAWINRGENGPASFQRYGIWAEGLASELSESELRRFLEVFSDIQTRLLPH